MGEEKVHFFLFGKSHSHQSGGVLDARDRALFGFIPTENVSNILTRAAAGEFIKDSIHILMDEPAFAGCLVRSWLLGVIEAKQSEKRKTARGDRLIGVAANSRNHRDLKSLSELNKHLLDEIEHFFIAYNEAKENDLGCSVVSARIGRKKLIKDAEEKAKQH